jgi:hypothetical protein
MYAGSATAEPNIAIWRKRGTHRPMCGEFAFEAKFKRADELHEKAMNRGRQFFIALQQSGHDWPALGTTKTGLVYRLKGNPPQAHEWKKHSAMPPSGVPNPATPRTNTGICDLRHG